MITSRIEIILLDKRETEENNNWFVKECEGL